VEEPVFGWKVPAGQGPQLGAPVVAWKKPATQDKQLGAPVWLNFPDEQLAQPGEPDTLAYVPAAHKAHAMAPSAEYEPCSQLEQAVPPDVA
jgi:hypothetical protein